MGHVIGVPGQENQVAGIQLQCSGHRLVKLAEGFRILRLPQGSQPPVLFAVRHLLGGKFHVHQVFPHGAGQSPAEEGQQTLPLFLRQYPQGLVKGGGNFLLLVYITSEDVGDAGFFRLQPAAQLADFLFVHGILLFRAQGA